MHAAALCVFVRVCVGVKGDYGHSHPPCQLCAQLLLILLKINKVSEQVGGFSLLLVPVCLFVCLPYFFCPFAAALMHFVLEKK